MRAHIGLHTLCTCFMARRKLHFVPVRDCRRMQYNEFLRRLSGDRCSHALVLHCQHFSCLTFNGLAKRWLLRRWEAYGVTYDTAVTGEGIPSSNPTAS